jgi:hypothetical protein
MMIRKKIEQISSSRSHSYAGGEKKYKVIETYLDKVENLDDTEIKGILKRLYDSSESSISK